MTHEQEKARQEKAKSQRHQPQATEAPRGKEHGEHHHPGHDEHRVVAIRHRHGAGDNPTQDERQRERQERNDQQHAEKRSREGKPRGAIEMGRTHPAEYDAQHYKAHEQIEHEQYGRNRHGIIDALGLHLLGRGQAIARVLLLVFGKLIQEVVGLTIVALGYHLEYHREDILGKESLIAADGRRQRIRWTIPSSDIPDCMGNHLERLAHAQGHENLYLIVNISRSLMQGVVIALTVGLNIRTQDIVAAREEVAQPGILFYMDFLAQLLALDMDERLAGPLLRIHNPANESLFGRESIVAMAAVDLLHEVEREGLGGTDAAVVLHEEPSEMVSRLLIGRRYSGIGQEGKDKKGKGHEAFLQHRIAKQRAERAFWIDEQQEQAQKQQRITRIGDGDAPWIVADAEVAALVVGIVAGLVKAVMAVGVNLVHRHRGMNGGSSVDDGEVGDVVFGAVGTGVIVDGKLVEFDIERKTVARHVVVVHIHIGIDGLVTTQMDNALSGGSVGDKRAQ